MTARVLSLFEGFGIETELMVVDAETLNVRPVVDELLRVAAVSDAWVEDVDDGPLGYSNELVCHVVELKTAGPVPSFAGLANDFQAGVRRLNTLLREGWNARLMPTAMHPWMNPAREAVLWPHDHSPVYRAFDALFDCRRHGWANLQSVHLNLSFADEREFARLLAAVRLVLPLIPALAASSPVVEGRGTGLLDNRLEYYRGNSTRARSMTADVIPEPIYDIDAYRAQVFGAIDVELKALGADRILLHNEWTNARGAIARFDRMAIEIRLIDTQENPRADLAVAAAVAGLVRSLVEERTADHRRQRAWPTAPLVAMLGRTIAKGPEATLDDRSYAELFGLDGRRVATAGDVWREVVERTFPGPSDLEEPVQLIQREGVLAQRIVTALGDDFDRRRLHDVYGRLSDCLVGGHSFRA